MYENYKSYKIKIMNNLWSKKGPIIFHKGVWLSFTYTI